MSKKKKKKKRPSGAKKPTYAKGKRVETPPEKAEPAAGKPEAKAGAKPGSKQEARPAQQWNLIRKGTLEAKVMWALLAIIAVAALMRYPLTAAEADTQYKNAKKQYNDYIQAWKKKYPTPEEQKKHAKEKPAEPKKPTTNVVMISVVFGALQSAIFAFLGLNILRRTDLGTPVLDKTLSGGRLDWPDIEPFIKWSIPAGLVMLASLYLNARISSDLVNSVFKAAESKTTKYPLWKEILGSFSDGLFFLVLFVLVAVPALVWLFMRYRDRVRLEPHYAGISAAFLLCVGFIFLNVSSTTRSAGKHVAIGTQAVYALALALPVLLLGYVFWKKGLEYSLLAGLLGFALYPIMASLIIK